jgi:DNA (cytosine-5)-methyltransferase 1
VNADKAPSVKLLDLFCGAGGAAVGYARAGFEVIGVDIKPQPHYPFEFHQVDALEVLADLDGWADDLPSAVAPFWDRRHFAAIHASPPCQAYSAITFATGTRAAHPDLLGPTRDLLRTTGLPYVIENVPGSPMANYITLCGTAFGLVTEGWELWRHRQFEANFEWPLFVPQCVHRQRALVAGVYGGGGFIAPARRKHGKCSSVRVRREIMGIDWMNRYEMAQAVPPAYTEWIGQALLDANIFQTYVSDEARS